MAGITRSAKGRSNKKIQHFHYDLMIGVFDSGIGGLTVAKAITSKLERYDVLYLGDTARVPYGNKSPELIYSLAKRGVDFLFSSGCSLVVVACNTISAEALRRLQREYLPKRYPDKKILGVIRPLAEVASRVTKNKRVGVIGTRGTVMSRAYVRELAAQDKDIKVFQESCPLLVPLIEEGWLKKSETKKILRTYLRPLKGRGIDTLILGCTHYPVLLNEISNTMGRGCRVLDSASVVAEKLEEYLSRHPEVEARLGRGKKRTYVVTDLTDVFSANAKKWIGGDISLEKVEI